jgi:BolA protein
MSLQDTIETKLRSNFNIVEMNVINESHLHAGHQPSFDGSGDTHFRIQLVAEEFEGQNRVNRHRAINELLKPELDAGLHALALELNAPGETKRW